MTFADHFDQADPLESLSWVAMPDDVRIQKLAYLYRKNERNIRYAHRNYCGPTLGTVKVFVRSLYEPPRGKIGSTTKAVLKEIMAQKEKRNSREGSMAPFKWKQPGYQTRIKVVAMARYRTYVKSYNGEMTAQEPQCKGLTTVNGNLLIVDDGGYYCYPRVYMRNKLTGEAKLVVMSPSRDIKSWQDAMMRLAPKDAVKSIFSGATIRLNFEEEGFDIDGELVPWANVEKIYRGDEVFKAEAKPSRRKKVRHR